MTDISTWPTSGRPSQSRLLAAVCATYARADVESDCIGASRWATDMLRRLGAPAVAMPSYHWVFSQRAIDLLDSGRPITDDDSAWSIATCPTEHLDGGYPGHLLALIKGPTQWVIDLSAAQFRRPAVEIGPLFTALADATPAPAWLRLPRGAHPSDVGRSIQCDVGGGTHICLVLNPLDERLEGWRQSARLTLHSTMR